MPPSIESILSLAFHQGAAIEANALIHQVREQVRIEKGQAINYEILLDRKTWRDILADVAPKLGLYLRNKGLRVTHCGQVFLSLFFGQTIYFVMAPAFFEHIRQIEGWDSEIFLARARLWEETGKNVLGTLGPSTEK